MVSDNCKPIKIAVFDVDRTILLKTSCEVQLIRFLRQRKALPFLNFLRMIGTFFCYIPFGLDKSVLKNKMYLYGIDAEWLQSLLSEYYKNYLIPRFSQRSLQYIRILRKKGFRIFLVSGSLDFLLDYLVDVLKLDGGMGSEMEIQNGRFTGWVSGRHPYYYKKINTLEMILNGQPIDYDNSYAFGDSWADAPLLSKFGHPVAMNPGKLLKRIAKKRGWKIVNDAS